MTTNIKSVMAPRVKQVTQLQFSSIMDLIDDNCIAIRVPNFFSAESCKAVAKQMRKKTSFKRYSMADDVPVRRIGMTLFETENEETKLDRYFNEAIQTSEKLRNLCAPCMNPLDLLRLRLEETWPEGSQIMKIEGRKMLPGIARMFEADASAGLPPHQDILERDIPDLAKTYIPTAQIAANVYLEVAPEGGELELWDFSPSLEEFNTLLDGRYDFLDRSRIPPRDASIRPQRGELILMRSDKVHAVRPSRGGERIAMSCFIGYFGLHKPLTYWA